MHFSTMIPLAGLVAAGDNTRFDELPTFVKDALAPKITSRPAQASEVAEKMMPVLVKMLEHPDVQHNMAKSFNSIPEAIQNRMLEDVTKYVVDFWIPKIMDPMGGMYGQGIFKGGPHPSLLDMASISGNVEGVWSLTTNGHWTALPTGAPTSNEKKNDAPSTSSVALVLAGVMSAAVGIAAVLL